MIPGLKVLHPHKFAYEWMEELGTRPRHEHKSGMLIPRYANGGEAYESA